MAKFLDLDGLSCFWDNIKEWITLRFAKKSANYIESNVIAFDENGNLEDSGYAPTDFAFRVPTATQGHIAGLDGTGNLTDAGVSLRDLGDIDRSHDISETEILYGKKIVRVQPTQWTIEDSTDSDIYVFDLGRWNIDGYNYLYTEYSNTSNDTVWVCVGGNLGGEYVLSIPVRQINPMTEMVSILETTRRSSNQSYLFFQTSHDYTQYLDGVYGVKDTQSMFAAVFDSSNSLVVSINGKEDTSNKISTISGNENNTTKYPNTKAVYDFIKAFADANNLTMP